MVKYESESKLGIITLNNSENGNVLNPESLNLIYKFLDEAKENKETRAIILKSNGKNFCLGMDLTFLQTVNNDKIAIETIELYTNLLSLIQNIEKPVISIVDGKVKAGGLGLMGACDIVIASASSSFEFSEIFFGLIPANVLPFIYNLRLSPQAVKYLIMTAKQINAEEAHRIGLVDEFFTDENFQKGIKKVLRNIFRASPMALAETKRFINSLYNKSQKDAIKIAQDKLLNLIKKPEVIAAIKSFQDGGVPEWFEKYNGLEL